MEIRNSREALNYFSFQDKIDIHELVGTFFEIYLVCIIMYNKHPVIIIQWT